MIGGNDHGQWHHPDGVKNPRLNLPYHGRCHPGGPDEEQTHASK